MAALLPDGRQVALFRDRRGNLYAIDNRDPFRRGRPLPRPHRHPPGPPVRRLPLLKQRFDLLSGQCLDDETVRVTAYEVRTA
ncbi:Nitrite reductase (NAD(P)H) small subunit OS=Streptomyces glaucescens OX=1907 GN=SGLAU_11365 PE=4 SV=1 [Streptomyces glaucescens]